MKNPVRKLLLTPILINFDIMNNQKQYIFELELKVRDYELDAEGIVNNANYLHYLELARHEFCESAGFSFAEMRRRGIDPVVSRAEIDYLIPLRAGERFVCKLNIERRGPRFIFLQDIFHSDGRPVLKAVITTVALENGRPTRGEALAEVFGKYL